MKKFWLFVFAIVVSFVPGVIGGFFSPMSPGANEWYNGLIQSVFTPNGWVFSVAWIILYTLLGIALFLIIKSPKSHRTKSVPYALFVSQMFLNALWCYLFFGLHMVGGAFIALVTLTVVAIWMAGAFRPISRGASYLVWPYIAWLFFALYLNGTIIMLN